MNYHSRISHQDRDFLSAKSAFIRAKKLSQQYEMRLRRIARHVGDIVRGFDDVLGQSVLIQTLLHRYADLLTPWAEAAGERMVAEVAQNDKRAWRRVSAEMGRSIHKEIESAPTGIVMRESMARQVMLIKSLPAEAAERVHKLTTEGLSRGQRSEAIVAEIMATGDVTRSRATLIARTETSRTATELTKSRAQHVGSTHFQWLTAGDSDVRPSHRKLNKLTFAWDDPPECDPGHHALPGAIWNCRCIALPILPDLD